MATLSVLSVVVEILRPRHRPGLTFLRSACAAHQGAAAVAGPVA